MRTPAGSGNPGTTKPKEVAKMGYQKQYQFNDFGMKSRLGTFYRGNEDECAECGKTFTDTDRIVTRSAGYVTGTYDDPRNGPVYEYIHIECEDECE